MERITKSNIMYDKKRNLNILVPDLTLLYYNNFKESEFDNFKAFFFSFQVSKNDKDIIKFIYESYCKAINTLLDYNYDTSHELYFDVKKNFNNFFKDGDSNLEAKIYNKNNFFFTSSNKFPINPIDENKNILDPFNDSHLNIIKNKFYPGVIVDCIFTVYEYNINKNSRGVKFRIDSIRKKRDGEKINTYQNNSLDKFDKFDKLANEKKLVNILHEPELIMNEEDLPF